MVAEVLKSREGGHHIQGPNSPDGLLSDRDLSPFSRQHAADCSTGSAKPSHRTVFKGVRMTIPYRIWVATAHAMTAENTKRIEREIDALFVHVDLLFNSYNPTSELSCLNHMPPGKTMEVTWETASFLQDTVQRCVNWSGGLYDPTVAPLYQHWQLRLAQGEEPTDKEVVNLKKLVGWDKLQLSVPSRDGGALGGMERPILCKTVAGVQCDLGGIAKGRAVDLLLNRLHALGYHDAYVDWGGDIRASGYCIDRPWLAALAMPTGLPDAGKLAEGAKSSAEDTGVESMAGGSRAEEQYLGVVAIEDLALATSGDYEQRWKVKSKNGQEKVFCHILSPLTGRMLEVQPGTPASASVLAKECALADGLATAAMATGNIEKGKEWLDQVVARSEGQVIGYCLMARDGSLFVSDGFETYLRRLEHKESSGAA